MSHQLLKADVLFYQRFLKANGFYHNILDGDWGPDTNDADAAFLKQSQDIAQQHGSFDKRSEENIITLIPKAQILARQFLAILKSTGKDVRIISGTRTYAEQDVLFRKGRFGNPPPKVTNAKGGQSNHNFGLAWDIGLFENGQYITKGNQYTSLSVPVLAQLQNLEWGGNWIKFKDFPHYQLTAVSEDVAKVRGLFEAGSAYA
jgi:peptidoglycan L-alanyl-D-glutamate endopeptidase CwlK